MLNIQPLLRFRVQHILDPNAKKKKKKKKERERETVKVK